MSSSYCATLYGAKKLIEGMRLVFKKTNFEPKCSAKYTCYRNKKALRGLRPPQGLEIYYELLLEFVAQADMYTTSWLRRFILNEGCVATDVFI